MQSRTTKISIKFKRGEHENNGSVIPTLDSKKMERKEPDGPKNTPSIDNKRMEQIESGASGSTNLKNAAQQHVDISSSGEDEECNTEDEDTPSLGDADKQLVLYDPSADGAGEIQVIPDPITYKQPSLPRYPLRFQSSSVLPSVGAFTVQCAKCFKWRLIPSKEKYEEIREHITDQPFVCEKARDWRPSISCNDPPDIEQDGSRLWAIDKPNIAQPPPGWQRLLRIRGEGSTKFADVYYAAPSGKRLRSMVEVQKFLFDNPKYIEQGVNMSQFSFQIPRPLQDNYVRKRPPRMTVVRDGSYLGMPGSLESSEVSPIAWAGPEENIDLQLGMPGVTGPYCERPALDPINRSAKKARSSSSSKRRCNFDFVYKQHQM